MDKFYILEYDGWICVYDKNGDLIKEDHFGSGFVEGLRMGHAFTNTVEVLDEDTWATVMEETGLGPKKLTTEDMEEIDRRACNAG